MTETALAFDLRMSRDEYRAWAEHQASRRFERVNGVVVTMAPERIGHNSRKMLVWLTLRNAIRQAGLPCDVYGDGITVEVGDSDYEPDAIVHCGGTLPTDAVAVPNPLIIVEVLSPSTGSHERVWKLKDYFRLSSLRHYLIVWPDKQQIVHHRRDDAGKVDKETVVRGDIILDPPGISFAIDDIYAE
jgi:Uma2 family endonuclease